VHGYRRGFCRSADFWRTPKWSNAAFEIVGSLAEFLIPMARITTSLLPISYSFHDGPSDWDD